MELNLLPTRRTKKEEQNTHREQYLEKEGIEQVLARVKHPQTNGKMERWFGCYKQHRGRFDKLEDFVDWYNDKRPHMSLKFNKAETPSEAFIRKIRQEIWFGYAVKLFNW